MNSDSFFSIQNMETMLIIFKDFMAEKFTFDVEKVQNIKKIMLAIMSNVQKDPSYKDLPHLELNIKVLSLMKQYCINKYAINTKLNVEVLDREKKIYGERPLKEAIIVPEVNQKYLENNFDRMVSERKHETGTQPPPAPNFLESKETVQGQDEFLKKLNSLQEDRNKLAIPPPPVDFKVDVDVVPTPTFISPLSVSNTNDRSGIFRDASAHEFHEQRLENNTRNAKTLVLNSGDRNVNLDSLFHYTLFTESHDNELFHVDHLILPVEKMNTFMFPFVFVKINGVESSLIYKSSYETPNGRAYCILKSVSPSTSWLNNNEKVEVSLMKPNGDFLELSKKDVCKVIKIETNYKNKGQLIVSLSNPADFKEMDFITIRNFQIEKIVGSQNEKDVVNFNTFINQVSGHQIITILSETTFIIANMKEDVSSCIDLYNLNNEEFQTADVVNQSLQHIIFCI